MKNNTKTPSFWTSFLGFLLKNVLLSIICLVAILSALIYFLRSYTTHGVEVEVPQITGLTIQEAEMLLQSRELSVQIIDSTYSDKVPLGMIVDQNPEPQSHVKPHRTIYVVTNARQRRQVVMPSLLDVSYRQAENTLRHLGLVVDSVRFEPSQYRELLLDIMCGDTSVQAGTRLSEGTHIVLVVGQGLGTGVVEVPNLSGQDMVAARSYLLVKHLTLGSYEYDEEPTEDNLNDFVVYWQSPAVGSSVREGTGVNIRLSRNLEKAVMTSSSNEEEDDFF